MRKCGFFTIDRNFWHKNFFGEKYMSLQCFAKFLAKIDHSGHCRLVNFPETPIFSKNDQNLRGKIEDPQKFLTKKIEEISAPKKTIFKKYISYILFSLFENARLRRCHSSFSYDLISDFLKIFKFNFFVLNLNWRSKVTKKDCIFWIFAFWG